MAKRNKSQGIMGRTDIPMAQRMLMQKRETIAEHRNEAAMVALQVACVALNDTEGWDTKGFPGSQSGCRSLSKNITKTRM